MMRYFDNAATSWPKPRAVIKSMTDFFLHCGGNPGRSGHVKAIEAGRELMTARENTALLLGIKDPARVIFTKNATEGINTVLYGLLKPGDHVVTTGMEHNAVLRPLTDLLENGVRLDIVDPDKNGLVDPEKIRAAIKPDTKLVAVNHASNVVGTINNVKKIGDICSEKNVPFLVDAAQTAGVVPIDVEEMHIDYLACSGHKGLLGPQGTGVLYLGDNQVLPLVRGGTGSLSDRISQPDFLPDRFESGTLNVIGIAGLMASLDYLKEKSIPKVMEHDSRLLEIFLDNIASIPNIITYGICRPYEQTGVLSVNIKNMSPSEVGQKLETEFGILTRIGLHCAPVAHKSVGTFPDGTVRLSWGLFTKEKDIIYAAKSLGKIASRRKG